MSHNPTKETYVEEREERHLSESNKKPLLERNVGAKRVGSVIIR